MTSGAALVKAGKSMISFGRRTGGRATGNAPSFMESVRRKRYSIFSGHP